MERKLSNLWRVLPTLGPMSPSQGSGDIRPKAITPQQNLETTDPGITLPGFHTDVYLQPDNTNRQKKSQATKGGGAIAWIQNKIHQRKELEEAKEIIAKIDRLPTAPAAVIVRYYDTDVTRLMAIARNHPKETHQLLRHALEQSPIPASTEVWYRQIQVACGDSSAIIPALESLERV